MKKLATLLALALAATALVACGDDDDGTTTTPTETGGQAENGAAAGGGGGAASALRFEADPGGGLAYTTETATAKAGRVTVELENPQALAHDVAIEDAGGETIGKTEIISESSDSTAVNLEPGEYTFYCTVPGHREGGMEGTLTIE